MVSGFVLRVLGVVFGVWGLVVEGFGFSFEGFVLWVLGLASGLYLVFGVLEGFGFGFGSVGLCLGRLGSKLVLRAWGLVLMVLGLIWGLGWRANAFEASCWVSFVFSV